MNSDYLKKFINFSVKDFDSFHQKAYPNAHARTHNSFRQGLKRLEKVYGDKLENLNLCFIKDPLDLYDKLNLSDYSHNTNITTFCMVLKLLKIVDVPLQEYNRFQNKLNLIAKDNQQNREDSLKEKLEFLPKFEDLKNLIRNKIDKLNQETSFQDIKQLVLVALMILSVPLKLVQYSRMAISFFKHDNKAIKNYIIEDMDGDYYIKSTDLSIKITDKHLKKLLKLWISDFNSTRFLLIANEESKVAMNHKDIRIALNTATKEIFEISFTNADIRSMYMRSLMELDPDFQQKLMLSKLLGYKTNDTIEMHS